MTFTSKFYDQFLDLSFICHIVKITFVNEREKNQNKLIKSYLDNRAKLKQ